MSIARGIPQDVAAVMEIVALCIRQMHDAGSDQWDNIYPDRAVIDSDVQSGCLFVFRDGESIAGAIVLNEIQSPEYTTVNWRLPDPRPLVIHRLCVRPDWQSKGAGRQLMDFAENFAATNGYASIRLDTYTGNPRAVALYERRGYQIAGYIRFPRRKLPFICFERSI
jgi:ribosomal protein S18 acetylase RimI-like enzyme